MESRDQLSTQEVDDYIKSWDERFDRVLASWGVPSRDWGDIKSLAMVFVFGALKAERGSPRHAGAPRAASRTNASKHRFENQYALFEYCVKALKTARSRHYKEERRWRRCAGTCSFDERRDAAGGASADAEMASREGAAAVVRVIHSMSDRDQQAIWDMAHRVRNKDAADAAGICPSSMTERRCGARARLSQRLSERKL